MTRTILFALAALGGLAAASTVHNPLELSSVGGSFTVGSGETLTEFSLLPFDAILDPNAPGNVIPNVGRVTFPQSASGLADPQDVGSLQLTYGDIVVDNTVWAMALDLGDHLRFGAQTDGLHFADKKWLAFRFDPVDGAHQSVKQFGLTVYFIDVTDAIPEPGTGSLIFVAMGSACGVYWIGIKKRRTKSPST